VPKQGLKSATIKGMFWNGIDKFAVQFGQFIIGIVLARILMPKDFGLIAMLSIFIAISQIFIESGMGTGLIQKKNRTERDFSTVFLFNFAVSIFSYIIIFIAAPFIAKFYGVEELTILTRVLSLNIVIGSISIIQRTKLTIEINFKSIAIVNIIATSVGGISGILFAYWGYGVWALVIKNLLFTASTSLLFILINKWKPDYRFSKDSFKELFGFGYKLLIAGIYAQTLRSLYNLFIGKYFSAQVLGYYDRANGYMQITEGTVTSILSQVTFPILASVQNDRSRMVEIYRRIIRMTAYFIIPSLTLLSLLADPFIRVILTAKWIEAVPFLQLLCFSRIFYPISVVNMNILNAIGRSDLFLKVDLSKFPIIVLTLIITIPLGIKAMIIGQIVISFISFFINAYLPGKYFGYGSFSQLRDFIPVILSTIIMSLIVYYSNMFVEQSYLKLLLGSVIGLASYLFVTKIFRIEEFNDVQLFLNKIKSRFLS